MSSWLPFVLLAVLSWGTYIPTLHRGQMALGGSGIHAFLLVGVAYLLVAITIPGTIVARSGSWHVFTPSGVGFTIGAGWARWGSCWRWAMAANQPSCPRWCLPGPRW